MKVAHPPVLFIFFLLLFPLFAQDFQANYINTRRVLQAYGVGEATFAEKKALFEKLDAEDMRVIASFEKRKDQVDTIPEFMTAALYSGYKVKESENQLIILEELSIGTTAGKRLAATWLRKRIDDDATHADATAFIARKSNVSEEEMLAYYREAVSAEIDSVVERVLQNTTKKYFQYSADANASAGAEKTDAIGVLKEYFVTPNDANYENLLEAMRRFGRESGNSTQAMARFRSFIRVIDLLSPKLRQRIARDIFKDDTAQDRNGSD